MSKQRILVLSHGDRGNIVGIVTSLRSGAWNSHCCASGVTCSPLTLRAAMMLARFPRLRMLADESDSNAMAVAS